MKPKLEEIIAELKKEYLEKFPGKLQRLHALLAMGEWQQLADEFHNLKGTGATYGFPEISRISEKMESFGKRSPDQHSIDFADGIQQLEKVYQFYTQKDR